MRMSLHGCAYVCFFLANPLHKLVNKWIVVQWLAPGHLLYIEEVTIEKDQTQMIQSKKCSEELNETPIPEYHVAKRVGPYLPQISIDSFQKTFLKFSYETKISIIDLAMTNMQSKNETKEFLQFQDGQVLIFLFFAGSNTSKKQYWLFPVLNSNST